MLIALVSLASPAKGVPANSGCVVAADGSGQYRTILEAVNAAPQLAPGESWTIHVKPGTYRETVYVQREKRGTRIVGEDPATTTLVYDLYAALPGPDGKPIGTFRTPTLWLDADDFTVENMTIANSAGDRGKAQGQALALRADGDRDIFRNCRFLGWQDTVLGNRGRHYFSRCTVEGAVDFIFGGATEYYDHCTIDCAGNGYITAASTPAGTGFGFVFDHCTIGGKIGVQTYLGRPWRDDAAVVFLECEMSAVVRPVGWNDWSSPKRRKTARYAEYKSSGPGANPAARAPWSRQLSEAEAKGITVEKVFGGWKP